MSRAVTAFLILAFALGRPVFAQLVNENLLVGMPTGYKVGFRDRNNTRLMSEMVPSNETVDDWTEMVTVQIFYGLNSTPQDFETRIEKGWLASCPGSTAQPVTSGVENGYPIAVWLLNCPRNPATGKPEMTWFKAIRGNDSFYVVQKAFKFAPSKDQVVQWMHYLRAVEVCDSRLPDRACPPDARTQP